MGAGAKNAAIPRLGFLVGIVGFRGVAGSFLLSPTCPCCCCLSGLFSSAAAEEEVEEGGQIAAETVTGARAEAGVWTEAVWIPLQEVCLVLFAFWRESHKDSGAAKVNLEKFSTRSLVLNLLVQLKGGRERGWGEVTAYFVSRTPLAPISSDAISRLCLLDSSTSSRVDAGMACWTE